MLAVIFRAKIKALDAEYSVLADALRKTALEDFGCIEFVAVAEGDTEIAISYWQNEQDIQRWQQHTEHLVAQRWGKERWYESYSVEVTDITRAYKSGQ